MDSKEVAERDGKARRTIDVNESTFHIDSNYVIDTYDNNEITKTGLLIIAKLHPKEQLPTKSTEFLFRWDGKANTLDIDPRNATAKERAKFTSGTSGYSGHHPKKLTSATREYEVELIWEGKRLYHGKIGFSLARVVVSSTSLGINVSVSHKVN